MDARRPPDFHAAASSEYSSALYCLNLHLVGAGKSNHQRGMALRDVSEISPTAREDGEPTERNLRELLGKDRIAVHAALVGSRRRNLRRNNGVGWARGMCQKGFLINLGAVPAPPFSRQCKRPIFFGWHIATAGPSLQQRQQHLLPVSRQASDVSQPHGDRGGVGRGHRL